MTEPGKGDDFFRCNGAGEMLVFSAADFEDFLEPRPELPASLEGGIQGGRSLLAAEQWPFRLHATYDESITRFLNVFEEVNRDVPFKGVNWFFDHCETVTDRNLERIKALGGGIAIQHRMAYQGEYFMDVTARKLPNGLHRFEGCSKWAFRSARARMRPAWPATIRGFRSTGWSPAKPLAAFRCIRKNCLSREEALRLYTQGSSWFSSEKGEKSAIAAGQLADLAALTDDYFSVPEEEIKSLESNADLFWVENRFTQLKNSSRSIRVIFRLCRIGHRFITIPGIGRQEAGSQAHACCAQEQHKRRLVRSDPLNLPRWILGPRGLLMAVVNVLLSSLFTSVGV